MGGSGSVSETQKKAWVTNIWTVPQQRDGSASGVYLLTTVIDLTRDWSLQDSTSSEQSWVRKARAWFLKVTLANKARAPLGPCVRCGGIELNTVVRAGTRMYMVCSYSAELIDMEEEDQGPSRPQQPRRKTSTRDLLTSVETSPDQDPGDCVGFQPRGLCRISTEERRCTRDRQ
jgi:hypothetical protein